MKRIVYTSFVVTVWVILMAGDAWARPWWWPWCLWGRGKALEATVGALQEENKAQQDQISALSAELANLAMKQDMIDDLAARLASAESKISELTAQLAAVDITGLESRLEEAEKSLENVQQNVQPVLELGEFVRVDTGEMNGVAGPHVIFEGANVHVRSGSGNTDDNTSPSGLGNLIIGYNEKPGDLLAGEREGSHNLVVGRLHRFSSWGGLVAGQQNTISGPYSSVSGGSYNQAIGEGASVSGGSKNDATGLYSNVSGGGDNVASGDFSSVSGGGLNAAIGEGASVSGGFTNWAKGLFASVGGGAFRQTSKDFEWAAGN